MTCSTIVIGFTQQFTGLKTSFRPVHRLDVKNMLRTWFYLKHFRYKLGLVLCKPEHHFHEDSEY